MTGTGGDLLAATLAAHGVEVAFGLHGGHLDPLLVASRRLGIRLVDTRHEAAAVNAADGYARVSGRVGVAFATAGAGFSNAVAGLGVAYADRSAVLLITSSPPSAEVETNALQGFLDQPAMARPVTKWAHRIGTAAEIPRLVGLAVRTALTGVPGPVLLDVPVDVLFGPAIPSAGPGSTQLPYPPAPAPEAVAEAVDLLRAARRPAVIAGGGLRGPAPSAALAAFAERADVPVFHPGMIVGAMPADHPLNGWSARGLGALVAEGSGPDLVVLAGARFGFYLGGRGGATVPLDAKVIQIDVDGAEFGRVRPFDVGITADVTRTLAALTAALGCGPPPDRGDWVQRATGVHRRPSPFADDPTVVKGRLHPFHGVQEVLRALDPDATLVVDGGEISAWVGMAMPQARPRRAIGCGYMGHLGSTPGLAIGAQLAEPGRRVVLLIGDGGAGFHVQEFDTMVRHGLPIVTVVVNNEVWGMSLHGQQQLFGAETEVVTGLADTDYDRVAAGFGAHGVRVDALADVAPAVRAALDHGGPACVNLAVSGEVAHPVTAALIGAVGAGGTVLPYYDNVAGADGDPAGDS